MKRYRGRKAALALAVIAGLGVSVGETLAVVYDANNWFAINSRASGIANGDTSSPIYSMNSPDTSATNMASLWSYFSPTTLSSGYSMTLNTSISIDYRTASSGFFTLFRLGIFNSGAVDATTDTFPNRVAPSDPSTVTIGWSGFFTSSGTNEHNLYRRIPTSASSYVSTGGTSTPVTPMAEELVSPVFADNVPISLMLTFERIGNDLKFFGVFGDDSFSGTYSNAFLSYSDSFDAIGFYATSPTSGVDKGSVISGISFSNTTITVVPEPSTVALLVVAGSTGFFFLRKRVRTV